MAVASSMHVESNATISLPACFSAFCLSTEFSLSKIALWMDLRIASIWVKGRDVGSSLSYLIVLSDLIVIKIKVFVNKLTIFSFNQIASSLSSSFLSEKESLTTLSVKTELIT